MAEIKKGLFPRLERLFSTDVVIRNVGGKKIKVVDTNHIQTNGELETNSLIDRYRRIFTNNVSSLYGAQYNQNYHYLRPQLYSEYDVMDQDAIIASALDIIADETTLKNDMGEVLSIRSSNDSIQNILYNLFYDILNIEFNLWSWVRQMAKYGDFFLKLEISEQYGVYNVFPYTAYHMEREEGFDLDNPTKVRFRYSPDGILTGNSGYYRPPMQQDSNNRIYFDNYEVAHFRLIGDTNYLPYGRSYIEPARKLFKQYSLMEDAMLIHRIVRAPEKRVFYVNVGNLAPNEIEAFMQKTITAMKKVELFDENGNYNYKYNMQNMVEDFYIPVRGNDGNATKIENTKGLDFDGIQDVEYLREKLFAALKIPKAFLGYDEHVEGKATLASEDIRFARTIERIQRIILSELNKIALVHLYSQGFKDGELTNFELNMQTPSIVFEQEKMELLKSKIEAAQQLKDNRLMPTDWIYDHIFNLSEDQYEEMRDLMIEDSKREFRHTQIENEGNDPYETGKAYGTPHVLANLYGKGRMEPGKGVPEGYDEEEELGRPQEKFTKHGTQDSNFGKDPLGIKRMKDTDKNDSQYGRTDTNRNGLLESQSVFRKNHKMFEDLGRKISLFSKEDENFSLLDENQLRE